MSKDDKDGGTVDIRGLDHTAEPRANMIPEMPDELQRAIANGDPVYNTEQMKDRYEVIGFMAPFVVVRRRSDLVKGTLLFTHSPRYYFGWEAHTDVNG